MSRLFALGAFLAMLVAPAFARAADNPAKADGPTVMLRLQSVDHLLANAEYIAGLAGKAEEAKQFLGFVKALTTEKGIEGVDTKRPFVLYATLADKIEESEGVFMIPIADKDSFLGLLKGRLSLDIKEDGGLYSTNAPNVPVPVFFRFANNYAYITGVKKEFIDVKKLAKPDDVIGKSDASVLSLSVRLDRIPEQMRMFALGAVEQKLAEGKKEKLPIDAEGVNNLKDKSIDSFAAGLKSILENGKEVTLKIDVDPKKDELGLEFDFTAKEGSALAKDFAGLKSKKSVALGSLSSNKAAAMYFMNISLPESVKKVLGPAVDDGIKMLLGMVPGEAQELVHPLIKSIVPTLKAGDLDSGAVLIGPNAENHYTVVVAGKVAEGKSIEDAVKEVVKNVPEPFKSQIELDADKVGEHRIHAIKVKDQLDDNAKKIFGETDLYLAFRDDAVLVAFGPDAKSALKDAIGKAPGAGSLIKVQVSATRLIALAETQDAAAAKAAAKKVFGNNTTGDTFTFSVEGGESLRVRTAIKGKVIQFFALMDSTKKAAKDK